VSEQVEHRLSALYSYVTVVQTQARV